MDGPPPQPLAIPAESEQVSPHLPMEEGDDGSLVIDLMPLNERCDEPEPDPLNPTIVVCRKVSDDQRIEPTPEVDDFANAIPRAQVELSDNAALSLDAKQKGVGGIPANAALATATIDF